MIPSRSARRRAQRRAANAPWIAHLRRTGTCSWCGLPGTATLLQAHHLDPARKRFGVGSAWSRSRRAIREELAGCTWLCQRCHTQVHQGLIPLDHPAFRPILANSTSNTSALPGGLVSCDRPIVALSLDSAEKGVAA